MPAEWFTPAHYVEDPGTQRRQGVRLEIKVKEGLHAFKLMAFEEAGEAIRCTEVM